MAKKRNTVTHTTARKDGHQGRGRKPSFTQKMERQISVGLDPERERQLALLREYLQLTAPSYVSDSDVMRKGFDQLVLAHKEEIPGLVQG